MKFLLIKVFLIFHLLNGIESLAEATTKNVDIEPAFINGIMNVIERARGALNKAVASLIESQRDNFGTGWPQFNIPPLDPIFVEHIFLEPEEFAGFSSFEMELNDTFIRGLQQFNIINVDIRPARLSAMIALSFDKLDFEGYHNTRASFLNGIFPITAAGSGPYTMTLNNVIASLFIQFELEKFRYIKLKELRINYLIGVANTNFTGFNPPFLTPTFNALASIAFPIFLDVQQIELNERIRSEIVPLVNEYILKDVTVQEFISLLIGFAKTIAVNAVIDLIQGVVCDL